MKDIYTIKIEDLSDKAEGIGRIDGKACFVPHSFPGEVVRAEIVSDKGRYFRAKRTDEYKKSCGGAPLVYMPYMEQLRWKEKHVRDVLTRIASLENPRINPIVGMDEPYHYRNKGEFKIGADFPYCNENCIECPIQDEKAMDILAAFRGSPRRNAEELIIRTNVSGQHLAYTVQKSGFRLLYSGEKILKDSIGHINIEVDPFSFYQVNTIQRKKLYDIVKSYVCEGDSLLDLYCGAGTIGLYCSDKCSRVIGVESLHEAILAANRNAIINHIVNTSFVEGKAETAVAEKLQGIKADTVIVDPPRSGCREELLKTIVGISPKRIIYVSCDPATLARDIRILCSSNKYTLIEATPVDMFPHTVHVETVCLLEHKI